MKCGTAWRAQILKGCNVVAVLAGPLLCEGSIAWAQSTFRLVGTIEGAPFTGAVIHDTKNPQAFYRLNDKLPDRSRLVKVLHNRIVLKLPDTAVAKPNLDKPEP